MTVMMKGEICRAEGNDTRYSSIDAINRSEINVAKPLLHYDKCMVPTAARALLARPTVSVSK